VFGGGALQMVACGVIGLFCMLLGLRQVAELIGMTWRFLNRDRHAGDE
jgi:hypothetical protein